MTAHRTNRLLLALLLLGLSVWAGCAVAAGKGLDVGQLGEKPVSLTEYFAVLEDPKAALSLLDVQKPEIASRFKAEPASASGVDFGDSCSAFWLRLTLRNNASHSTESVIDFGKSKIGTVVFYYEDENGVSRSVTTGISLPFETRPYNHRNLVFPVTLAAHRAQTYYFRLQSADPVRIPVRMRILTSTAFHEYEVRDYLGHAWFFGMACAMIVFNLLLALILRDTVYLQYVGFVFCVTLQAAAETGMGFQFLWRDSPRADFLAMPALVLSSHLALISLLRRMVDTARIMPRYDRVLVVIWYIHFFVLIAVVCSYRIFGLFNLLVPVVMTAALVAALLGILKKERGAIYFLAAFIGPIAGAIVNSSHASGLMPIDIPPETLTEGGAVFEMIMLAFALADRYKQFRQEKDRAQRETIEAQAQLNSNLEWLVEIRTKELSESNKKLEHLSVTDKLTGLSNRLKLEQVIEDELNRSRHHSSLFSLVLIDIDAFKSVNDTYGHPIGDQVLIEVARLLLEGVREADCVGRWGGEEYLIICPDMDAGEAAALAETLRRKIDAHAFAVVGNKTLSFGVSGYRNGDTPARIMKRADDALYRAKKNGRNRVESV